MFGEIRNDEGERLDYAYHEGAEGKLVLIGHGVTGNKDRPFVVALAEGLSAAGIAVLRFSFSGNGESEGRFIDSTITKEVTDLRAVIDAVGDRRLCYVGHSMGGAVGVIAASQEHQIRFLVSLAGMVHTRAFAAREFGDVTPDDGCMWDEPDCPLSSTYMNDMNQLDSVVELGAKMMVPWLLVHGTDDDVVPIQDSRDIIGRTRAPTELFEISNGDHVFNDDAMPPMVNKVVEWTKTQFQV